MSEMVKVTLPFESLDPLTIGSCDDPSMVYREEISIELPKRKIGRYTPSDRPLNYVPERY